MRLRLAMALALAAAMIGTSSAETNLNGAGATFPNPIYQKWFSEYHNAHNDVQINYQSIGSGGGIAQLTAGTVDFGASDGPMTDEQLSKIQGKVFHIPTVLGAVVPTYNVSGVSGDLKFTPDVLADIFLGNIKKWSDPRLAKANPGVKFPDEDIAVIHRAEGSGTTYIFTDYLSKVSSTWKDKVGKGGAVNWPTGLAGKGNEGVSGMVKQTEGSIGYVELIYAISNKMPYGVVQNAAGAFVKASLESVTAAAASVKDMPDDFRVSITNADGKTAYPISSFTWLLIPEKISDAGKRDAIKGFLKWALGDGQTYAENLSYARLPKEVIAKEEKAISKIQ